MKWEVGFRGLSWGLGNGLKFWVMGWGGTLGKWLSRVLRKCIGVGCIVIGWGEVVG